MSTSVFKFLRVNGGIKLSTKRKFCLNICRCNRLSRGFIPSQNNCLKKEFSLLMLHQDLVLVFLLVQRTRENPSCRDCILNLQISKDHMTHELSPPVRSATANSFLPSIYSLLHCSQECGQFMLQPTVMLMMKEKGKLFICL